MSTATELLIEQPVNTGEGAISQGSPSQPQAGLKGPEAPPPWLDGVQDTELREFIQNKGWNDPAEMAQGYRNLEKLVGGEKLWRAPGKLNHEL
jgi:hypothetical protein